MRVIASLMRRLRSLSGRDAGNVELREELEFHLTRAVEEKMALGLPECEARRAARAEFGSLAEATEDSYRARGVGWLEDLGQDVRYGLRSFARDRGFTVVTVLTLALGIGACTAIFSVVNAVLLRSLPYGNAGRLVYLYTPLPHFTDVPPEAFGPSNADFYDLKRLSKSYAAMTLFSQASYSVAAADRLERVGAAKVDEDFFPTLQAGPELGRVFTAGDEQPGQDHVVVVSHAMWQGMFG